MAMNPTVKAMMKKKQSMEKPVGDATSFQNNPTVQAMIARKKAMEAQGTTDTTTPTQVAPTAEQMPDTTPTPVSPVTQAVEEPVVDNTPVQANPTVQAMMDKKQTIDTGKGLPEPDFLPGFAGSSFESDIQSVYWKGKTFNASPEEMANMIKAKYGDKYQIQVRDVSQQEKDAMWTPDVFLADKEYIVRDRTTGEALSLNNPGVSLSEGIGATTAIGKELPGAFLTRGRSLGTKMAGMGASGASVNIIDQGFIKGLGGKEEINPWEIGLAGALTAGGEVFGPIIWAGTKAIGAGIKGVGNAIGSIGRRLDIDQTRRQISDATDTPPPENALTKADAEKALEQYKDGWTVAQRNRVARQALYGQGTVGNLDDIRLTPAEQAWDPTQARFKQDDKAAEALQTEEFLRRNFPGYAETLDKRLDNVASLVDREVSDTYNAAGREIAKLLKDKKDLEQALEAMPNFRNEVTELTPEQVADQERATVAITSELKRIDEEIEKLKPEAETPTAVSSLSKEELEESVAESANVYHQSLKDIYKGAYKAVQDLGNEELTDDVAKTLIPRKSIEGLPQRAKPIIDQFEVILKGEPTIGGKVEPTLNNIEEARKYLNSQVERLYNQANANFDPVLAEKLRGIREEFDNNLDNFIKDKTSVDAKSDLVSTWSVGEKIARKEFAAFKEKFGEDKLLKKVVDEVNKGQKSVSQITNMLFNISGQPKFGSEVAKTIEEDPALRNAVKDYIYATTFFDKGNIVTGQKVTTRFDKVKNNEGIKDIFGDEWDDFVEKAEKLQQIDVVRGSKAQGSPTQPKEADFKAWESLLDKKEGRGFRERALDYLGVTKDAQDDDRNKELLKQYVLDTVYTAEQMPELIEGKASYVVRPTAAASAQQKAGVTGEIIDSATSNDKDDE